MNLLTQADAPKHHGMSREPCRKECTFTCCRHRIAGKRCFWHFCLGLVAICLSLGSRSPQAVQSLVFHTPWCSLTSLSFRTSPFQLPGGHLMEPGLSFLQDLVLSSFTLGYSSCSVPDTPPVLSSHKVLSAQLFLQLFALSQVCLLYLSYHTHYTMKNQLAMANWILVPECRGVHELLSIFHHQRPIVGAQAHPNYSEAYTNAVCYSGFVRKIKIGNYKKSSEMILSAALLVVGPI